MRVLASTHMECISLNHVSTVQCASSLHQRHYNIYKSIDWFRHLTGNRKKNEHSSQLPANPPGSQVFWVIRTHGLVFASTRSTIRSHSRNVCRDRVNGIFHGCLLQPINSVVFLLLLQVTDNDNGNNTLTMTVTT
jgi:hypothetical protein